MIDLKNILIVLHGNFKINNDKNIGIGHPNNANTLDTNIGEEQGENEHSLQSTSQLTELCWEVFDPQNKKSLNGIQSVKQETFIIINLKDNSFVQPIQNFINNLRHDQQTNISFLVSDKKLYSYLKNQTQINWINSYPFYEILNLGELVFSERKNNLQQLLDYFSLQNESSQLQKSETFQTALLISKLVLIILRTTIPFKNPLNESILIQCQLNKALNQDNKLKQDELWGEEQNNNDVKHKTLIGENNGGSQNNYLQNKNNSLGQLIATDQENQSINKPNVIEQSFQKRKNSNNNQNSRSRSRSKDKKESRGKVNKQNQDSDDEDDYSDKNSQNSSGNIYIRLRGLPFNSRESELLDFLGTDLEQEQIAFKHDKDGRFSGECIIKAKDQEQYNKVMEMNMRNMGKRYIEMFEAEKVDYIRALKSQNIDDFKVTGSNTDDKFDAEFLQNVGIVKIRGLPYDSNDEDILQFFSEQTIVPNGISKVYEGKRPSGEAFILFATKQDAKKAIEKDKQRMGTRYIEIFLSHPKEYTTHIKKRKQSYSGGSNQYGYQSNRYQNYGGNGRKNSYNDNYEGKSGGYSSNQSNYRNNYGKQGNYNYRRSNSPQRNNFSSPGQYKKPGYNNYGNTGYKQHNSSNPPNGGGDNNKDLNNQNFRQKHYQNNSMNHSNRSNNYQNDFNRASDSTQIQKYPNQQHIQHQQFQQHSQHQQHQQNYQQQQQQSQIQYSQQQNYQYGNNNPNQYQQQAQNAYQQQNNQYDTNYQNTQQFQYNQPPHANASQQQSNPHQSYYQNNNSTGQNDQSQQEYSQKYGQQYPQQHLKQ